MIVPARPIRPIQDRENDGNQRHKTRNPIKCNGHYEPPSLDMLVDHGNAVSGTAVDMGGKGADCELSSIIQPLLGLALSSFTIWSVQSHREHSRWWSPTSGLSGRTLVRIICASHFGHNGRVGISRACNARAISRAVHFRAGYIACRHVARLYCVNRRETVVLPKKSKFCVQSGSAR